MFDQNHEQRPNPILKFLIKITNRDQTLFSQLCDQNHEQRPNRILNSVIKIQNFQQLCVDNTKQRETLVKISHLWFLRIIFPSIQEIFRTQKVAGQ